MGFAAVRWTPPEELRRIPMEGCNLAPLRPAAGREGKALPSCSMGAMPWMLRGGRGYQRISMPRIATRRSVSGGSADASEAPGGAPSRPRALASSAPDSVAATAVRHGLAVGASMASSVLFSCSSSIPFRLLRGLMLSVEACVITCKRGKKGRERGNERLE